METDIDISIIGSNLTLIANIEYLKTKNITFEIINDIKDAKGEFICYFDRPLKFRENAIHIAWMRLFTMAYDRYLLEYECDKKYMVTVFFERKIHKCKGSVLLEDEHSLFYEK